MSTPCTTITIPANSYTNSAACDNPQAQAYLTGLHQILQCEYDNMVSEFFTGSVPAAKTILASTFDLEVDCTDHYIAISFSPANTTDNDEITATVEEGEGTPGNYSVALFKGIFELFAPDAFHFSKSIGLDGNAAVAFYVTLDSATVYCGDLAGLLP